MTTKYTKQIPCPEHPQEGHTADLYTFGHQTRACGNVLSQTLQTAVNTKPRMSKKPCKTIWAFKVTTRPNIQSTFATIVNANCRRRPRS